jgi:hypothetical protein
LVVAFQKQRLLIEFAPSMDFGSLIIQFAPSMDFGSLDFELAPWILEVTPY